jgi:hypothetical protein
MLNKLIINQKKFTLNYNLSNPSIFLSETDKTFIKKIYEPRIKVKRRLLDSNFLGKLVYDFLNNSNQKYDEKTLKRLIKNFSKLTFNHDFKSNKL